MTGFQSPLDSFCNDLRRTLEEVLFSHRETVDAYDLSGFDGTEKKTLHMAFSIPPWMARTEAYAVMDRYDGQADPSALLEARDVTISNFLKEKSAENWTRTIRQGNVTMVFDEAPADHPATPLSTELGNLLAIQEIAFFGGRAICCAEKGQLKNDLAALTQWLDAAKTVENDIIPETGEKLLFNTTLRLEPGPRLGIDRHKILCIGEENLHDPWADQHAMLTVLRHERGHYLNGDHGENLLSQAQEKLSTVLPAAELMEHIATHRTLFAEWLASGKNSKETAVSRLRKLDDALTAITPDIATMAAQVKAYPWFDELNGMAVAADAENETSFSKHVQGVAAIPENLFHQTIIDSNDYSALYIRENMGAEAPHQPQTLELARLLTGLVQKHSSLAADLNVLEDAYRAVSQGIEHLADFHAVAHAENPEKAGECFTQMEKAGFRDNGYRGSHPFFRDRDEMCGHFGRRFLRQKAMAAASQSHER